LQDTLAFFHTDPSLGLSASTVPSLLAEHGYNEFTVSSPEPLLLKFAKTIYESPLILLLCGSAVVSAVMGNIDDAVSITIAVLIVLTVGFVQEQRSEKSLEALNKLVPHHCHLIRDGKQLHTLANELVPGDIVTFTTGDRIPADVRLISAVDLEIDESSLTGETDARRKDVNPCSPVGGIGSVNGNANGHGYLNAGGAGYPGAGQEPVALAERSCIAYMGTLVRSGYGSGVVIATGTQTEFGVIFSMMQDVEEKRTPLQLKMDELAQKLSMFSFGVIGVICIIGVLQNRSWLEMFTIGVSLAVAAIPEGLPIVTTVTLALGVLRMSKRKAIVKKLHSVEALGSVSVICSDKTGTLTKNEQTVTELYSVDEVLHIDPSASSYPGRVSPAVTKTLEIGSLCNNAIWREEDGGWVGQATDVALLNVLNVFGMGDLRKDFQRESELAFSSERKYMAVSGIHLSPSSTSTTRREMYYIKGSIDAIIERCKFYYVSDDSTPGLDSTMRSHIISKAQSVASRGLRVIAMAYGYTSPIESTSKSSSLAPRASTPAGMDKDKDKERNNLVFVGFQAMLDPPRKGVADAINLLQSGGVQVVMITGDAEQTALSIARELGLRVGRGSSASGSGIEGNSSVLTGQMIDRMSKAQLRERVGNVSVFARTTPKHKMAIVEAFQSRGAVVAMTGDGVNDAPALKMADIGVSMGKSGTDVAKEAADVILVDDNFNTILPAVEEGKSIFHNIQNFLSFQLSTAVAALTLITLSTFFGLSNPLNAMQILFINILMDGPPSQSLGVDPVDPAVMRRPPRKKDEPIISRRLLYRVLFSASIIVVGTLFIYTYALSDDHMSRREQTMTFTCFVFLDLVSAIQNRGLGCGFTQNKMLITTVSISFIVQLSLIYVPFMQAVFQTAALDFYDFSTLLVLAAISMTLHEGRRRYERALNADLTFAHVAEEMA
ncbi:calcium-transporting P, partial [Panus rudis PR-1116 ss-1]